MPTYVYKCEHCDTTFERRQSFSDAPLTSHDECGGPVRKLIVAAPVIFKGSGFYSTDNRVGTNGSSGENGAKGDAEGGEGATGDTAKSESSKGETSKSGMSKGESPKSESSKSESPKNEGSKKGSSTASEKAASTSASD